MKAAILNFVTGLAKMLIPFVAYYGGYNAGQDDKEKERLEAENVELKKEIERLNSRPVTSADINKLFDTWAKQPKD